MADTPAVTPQPAPEVLPEVVARALADPDTADRSRAIARVIAACVTAGLSVGQTLTVITGYGPATRYKQPRHMAADVARFYAKVTAERAGGHNAAPPARHPPAAPASAGRTGGPAPTAPTNGHQVIAPPAEPDDRSPEPLAFPEPLGPHDPTGPDTRRSGATANGSANDAPGTERGGERPGDQDDTGDAHDDGHDGATGVGAGGVTSDETGDGGGDAPTADHGGEGEASQADDGPDLHMLAATVFQLSGDVSCLNTRLGEVEDQVISHAATFDDLERLGAAASGRAEPRRSEPAQPAAPRAIEPAVEFTGQRAASEEEPETGGLDMRALVRWVGDHVAALLERRSPQSGGWPYWCRAWWMHPEAIARFEAARRCWAEAVTGEGAAMVVYFEHLDAMLAVLCAENGPFCSCTDGQHRADGSHTGARILGQDWPPEDYYTSLAAPLDPADVHAHGAGSGAAARPDRSGPDDALAGVAGGGGFGEVGSAGGCQLTAAHRPAEARRRADTR